MTRLRLSLRLAAAFMLPVALIACGPANQNSTVSTFAVGTQGSVRYGTVVGMRPVQVAGTRSGVGTGRGDWRARTVGGVAGALLGGLAGTVVEEGVSGGQGVEFIIRGDEGGPDQAVIQTNEQGLRVGERVALSYTDRVRIARAVNAPPVGYSPGGK